MQSDEFTPFLNKIKSIKRRLDRAPTSAQAKSERRDISRMLSDKAKEKITPSTVLAEMMTAAATANPCIMARRCNLVPYKETEGRTAKRVSLTSGKAQAKSGKGCCPGQTGHHVLPGAMFGKGKGNPCKGEYKHSQAPVVCLEGAGNQVGSHGTAHEGLDETMTVYKETGATKISYSDACKQGIAAVRQVNPSCSEACLQAQLDTHYVEKLECGDADLIPHSGMGGVEKKKDGDDNPSSTPPTGNI